MFTKKPESDEAYSILPAKTALNSSTLGPLRLSYLGPDLTIVGNLESHGQVQIEGTITGDVHARQITVGSKALVTGNIVADDVSVAGVVNGSVRGLAVTLQSGSRVDGDMHYKSLAIEHGAHFEGQSRKPQDVAELAPKLQKRS